MSYSQLNTEIVNKFKNMKLEYSDKPQPELLLPIPNPNPGIDYTINITSPEVTSLCPITPSQPDYATITITYAPDQKILELKSVKFYLTSFRTVEIFHEQVVGDILNSLVYACEPKWMEVIGEFKVRGGIKTTVTGKYVKEKTSRK